MMAIKLRSNFAVGSTLWALRRAQWTALGIDPVDMEKPKIAVINSSSELSICFSHLDRVCNQVKEAIRAAGGLPFEIKTTAPSDFIHCAGSSGSYILPSRDLLVNDIETSVEGPQLDGMICLASCDKTAPAQMMAAARLNIPTILVIGGYQASGNLDGERVDIEDVFEGVGRLGSGDITLNHLKNMSDLAVAGPGVCAGMGTANSMHIMAEVLGMALPGSAPIAAESTQMYERARAAGQRIVELVEQNIRPREILTPDAFHNAATVALALSASINVMRHLQAIAEEGHISTDIYEIFTALDGEVPVLCGIKPNGDGRIEDLDNAGGTRAVLKRLEPLLKLETRGVDGNLLADQLAETVEPDYTFLSPLDAPVSMGPSLAVLRGSLAPEGAIMKLGTKSPPDMVFRGPARVFSTQEAALQALEENQIEPGEVVVLRGLGARGGPGVASASWFAAALAGSQLAGQVALVTDGQLSGLNHGIVVGQVMPESAMGGPISAVQDGDWILLNLPDRRVDLEIDQAKLIRRLTNLKPQQLARRDGWLGQYQQLVAPLSQGGVLRAITDKNRDQEQ